MSAVAEEAELPLLWSSFLDRGIKGSPWNQLLLPSIIRIYPDCFFFLPVIILSPLLCIGPTSFYIFLRLSRLFGCVLVCVRVRKGSWKRASCCRLETDSECVTFCPGDLSQQRASLEWGRAQGLTLAPLSLCVSLWLSEGLCMCVCSSWLGGPSLTLG